MLQPQDEHLRQEIEHRIGMLSNVELGDLRVTVRNGVVRITGVVDTHAERQAAIDAAFEVQGVLGVDAAVAVETPHPVPDHELAEAVGSAMNDEEDDEVAVGAAVRRGVAMLRGEASSVAGLGRAVDTAGSVPGTVDMIDGTRIANPYGADQTDLVNAIADAITRDPTLRTRAIRPLLEDTGKAVLRGTVRSTEEARHALEVAGAVPGVHTVREELHVVP